MTQQEYTPYGEEWKKEMAKLPKSVIIDIAANLGVSKSTDLIDDFAKAAMHAMLTTPERFPDPSGERLAKTAYFYADFMMQERERRIEK